jgi:hypothetical protein
LCTHRDWAGRVVRAHCWLTEPSRRPAKPPSPRDPTTRRSASTDSSTRTEAGGLDDATLDLCAVRVGRDFVDESVEAGLGGGAQLFDFVAGNGIDEFFAENGIGSSDGVDSAQRCLP